jgi:hypothetical protein
VLTGGEDLGPVLLVRVEPHPGEGAILRRDAGPAAHHQVRTEARDLSVEAIRVDGVDLYVRTDFTENVRYRFAICRRRVGDQGTHLFHSS